MVDAGYGRQPWRHAGGEHDLVEAASQQLLRVDPGVQLQRDAGQVDLAPVETQRLVELLLARNLLGDVELAADLVGRIEQRHVESALRCGGGETQAGRTGADHGDAAFRFGGHDVAQCLVAGARVHQAGRDLAGEGVVQAGLVAADAGIDLIGPALFGLAHEQRVGQEGAGHRDHVAIAVGQQLLGDLGRVDAVGGHQRNADLAHQLPRDPAEGRARHLGGNRRNTRLVPADAGVDDGGAGGLDRLGQLHDLVQCGAALDQVEHGQAVDDDAVAPDPFARAAHDLDREADAVLVGATPGVVALVGARGDELVDQITFGAHDLDAVVAGALRQRGATHEVLDGLLDLLGTQRLGLHRVDRCLQRAGSDQVAVVGVTTEVQDLQRDLAAGLVHGLGHRFVFLGLGFGRQPGAARHRAATVVRGDAAGDDQADAAGRAFGVERRHAGEAVLDLLQADVHRAHQHPVGQGGEAQVERGQQVGIRGRHRVYILGIRGRVTGGQVLVRHYATSCSSLDGSENLCNWLHSAVARPRLAPCPCPMPYSRP